MQKSGDLLSLVETLVKTHNPSAKLRLLGRSWKLLRNLTPRQRERLFAAQGLKQADAVLRRLGGIDERSGDTLLALADQLEKAGAVDKLGKLFQRVHKGEVTELVEEGLTHLEEQILGSQEADQAPPLNLAPLPVNLDPPAEAEPPPPPPSEVPADLPEPKTEEATRTESLLAEETFAPAQEEPIPADEPVPEPPVHRVVAEVAPVPVESPESETGRRETETRGEMSLLERLCSEERLLDRFRLVRNHLAELSEPGEVTQAVEAFPEGWARRRFVTRLIREGKVGFEEACQLLQQLPAGGEHWGVSAILERYPLNMEQLSLLREVVRSPLSRRRVQRHRV